MLAFLAGNARIQELMGCGLSVAQANALSRVLAGTGHTSELTGAGFSGPEATLLIQAMGL